MTYSNEYMWLKGFCSGRRLHKSVKALSIMHKAHGSQLRNDGIPYYEHPVRVANYLIELDVIQDNEELDTLICVAILHDVLEDTSIKYDEIEILFGHDVARRVRLLSKEKGADVQEYFKKIQEDFLIALVKCSDRTHNISGMIGIFKPERMERYIKETETYILPLLRHLRESYPEIGAKMVIMSYHIKSILSAAQEYSKLVGGDKCDSRDRSEN